MRILKLFILAMFCTNLCFASPEEGIHYNKVDHPSEMTIELYQGMEERVKEYRMEFVYLGLDDQDKVKISINYADRDVYSAQPHDPGDTGWRINPRNYGNMSKFSLRDYAQRVYRTHYACTGQKNYNIHSEGNEIIELSSGYANHTGTVRFYQQCILDGSFDGFYDEVYDFGDVDFQIGEPKNSNEFSITVVNADDEKATVKINYIGNGRYLPSGEDLNNGAAGYLARTKN